MPSRSQYKDKRSFTSGTKPANAERKPTPAFEKKKAERSPAKRNGKPEKKADVAGTPVKKRSDSILTVTENCQLLDFLIASLKDQSRTTVKSLLAHQQITIKNRVIKQFDYQLKVGDEVSIHWEKGKTTLNSPLLKIVYEDRDLIVVEKAAGLLSIATQKEPVKTAYSMLSEYVKKQHPGNKIFVVHRLDRETSGLMLFAKNEEVQFLMQHNWRFAVNQRRYVAVVEGKLETGDGSGKGTIKSYLWESRALIVYSSPNPEDGQVAVTNYHVLKSNDQYSLLELELETGRKNQIRVQLNSIGFPLVGDLKYGGHPSKLKRLALHAHVLSFTHPVTKELHSFETPIPEAFRKMVE
ncbi:MAG: RluA family pseudouridine synthase [Bacteroidota bacterium]|nr:RluA family pseudouridine synthase [Bacteroidota bacterium]